MSKGVEIRILDRSGNREGVVRIPQLPVRIGRNNLNDLVLAYNFVSQFHATLALTDGKLVLRDLGSTNGVMVGGHRVPPNTFIDLSNFNNCFSIVSLSLEVTVQEMEQARSLRLRSTASAVPQPPPSQQPPAGMPAHPTTATAQAGQQLESVHRAYGAYRTAAAEVVRAIHEAMASSGGHAARDLLQRAQVDFPMIAYEPEFRGLLARHGLQMDEAAASSRRLEVERLALTGLQEIAMSLMPKHGAPESLGDLAIFMDKLKATLDVFLGAFVQLRDGYRQFETDMAIRQRPSGVNVNQTGSVHELAISLLDWRRPDHEGTQAVSAYFADFMIRQVALLNGVMNGVKTLMREMSPEELEKLARQEGDAMAVGPLRYRPLWRAYEKRYRDLTEEDKRLFDLVFGETFATGYENSLEKRG